MSSMESLLDSDNVTGRRLRILLPVACVVLFVLPAIGHYTGGVLAARVAGVELALFLGWISLVLIPLILVAYVYTVDDVGEDTAEAKEESR